MTNLVQFTGWKMKPMLQGMMDNFISDPPDSPYQYGYLAAVMTIYREVGLGDPDDPRLSECDALLANAPMAKMEPHHD